MAAIGYYSAPENEGVVNSIRGQPCISIDQPQPGGNVLTDRIVVHARSLATLAEGACLGTAGKIRNFFAEGCGEVNLMVLLLH